MANLVYPVSGHTVDDKFSPLLEPNLWYRNIFIPGVTFTDKYQLGPAGQFMVHKPGVGTVTSTLPGADFSDSVVEDAIITISLNEQFNRSRKIFGATLASVAYPAAASEMETAIQEVKKGWTLAAYTALIETTSVINSTNILTVASVSDIYDTIVDDRAKLVATGVTPDTLIVTPAIYAMLLKSDEFQRTGLTGDNVVSNAIVGRVAGLNVVEYEAADSAAVDGQTIGGVTWATGDLMEYVMYDSDTFSIVTSVEAMRLVEEPTRFIGTLAQVQIVSGFKVTNPARVLLKFHDTSAGWTSLTFDLNGGNIAASEADVVVEDVLIDHTIILDYEPFPVPVYTANTLTGWAYDAGGTSLVGATDLATADDTIYAVWEAD